MHDYKLNCLIVNDRSCTQNLKSGCHTLSFLSFFFILLFFLLSLPFVNSVQLYIYLLIGNKSSSSSNAPYVLLFSFLNVNVHYFFCREQQCIFILQINFVNFVSHVSHCITCNLNVCALYEYLHEANTNY